jgi:hypothetical protein
MDGSLMMKTKTLRLLAGLVLAACGGLALQAGAQVQAQTQVPTRVHVPDIFKDADLPLGEKLMNEHACSTCHSRKVGGDGSAIYRPAGRINTPGALRGMVDMCNTELNLGLFPEEVTAVAAVLQRDHYRFPAPRK